MLEVLTNPNSFFKRKINEDIELKTPLMIIGILAVIAAISAYIVTMTIMELLPAEAAAFAGIGTAFAVVGAIIGTLLAWFIYTVIFYLVSIIFHGEGDFKRVAEFVSYGLIPSIPASLINLYMTRNVFAKIDFTVTDQNLITESIMSDPTMRIATILGLIFLLWSANIWIFGLMYSRNISLKNAIMTVGIPIVIYMLYTLANLTMLL
jgi:hypothetical protein